MSEPRLRVLSLGAGVQSTTMALLAAAGEIRPPDHAIFADTGWEPKAVYAHLDRLEGLLPFPLHRVQRTPARKTKASLLDTILAGEILPIPGFASGGGMRRRECTRDFKLEPIQRQIKKLLGIERPVRRALDGHVVQLVGISTDEASRMKPSRVGWLDVEWPLIDLGMSRTDCMTWLAKHGHAIPPKSACLGCPYHDNRYWRRMKAESPDEWADTVAVERRMHERRPDIFFHSQRVPLDQVDLGADEGQQALWDEECEGMCGV